VECGITACTFGVFTRDLGATFEAAQTSRGFSIYQNVPPEALRLASTPERQHFDGALFRFHCFLTPAYFPLPLHRSLLECLTGETWLRLPAKISTFHLWGC
jgi:hypothetical protein